MFARIRQASTAIATVILTAFATACAATGSGQGDPRPARRPAPEHGATAVSVVTAEDVANVRAARIEEFLMGRVPGLTVYRTANGDYTMRIRGMTSFRGNDEPLVIVDGMPLIGGGASRSLAHLNPADVARVEVLKDAGALAMYGVQGGNGVILITTRRR